MTSAAPSSRNQLELRVEPVVITRAPKNVANWMAKWPTPPDPAWMSMTWPSCALATSTTAPHAVSAASGTPAASTCASERGLRAMQVAGTVMYSA